VQEPIYFIDPHSADGKVLGFHRARFGEIEQRGVALTPSGLELYQRLMNDAEREFAIVAKTHGPIDNATRQAILQRHFQAFPDTWEELRAHRLAYFRYVRSTKATRRPSILEGTPQPIDTLIDQGIIRVEPIIYEDFLPASAAGIFHSNLGDLKNLTIREGGPDREAFEAAMGAQVVDGDALYQAQQLESMMGMLESTRANVRANVGKGGVQSVF
jgi:uncharacterized glyoxalase superfamily metalloenzyme YdcJ